MIHIFALLFALAAVWTSSALAVDQRVVLDRIVTFFVLPRYDDLAAATVQQATVWQKYCDGKEKVTISDLDQAYHAAADAWSGVELVRYGPISQNFRLDRMAHWPERRNAVDKALDALLARNDIETITQEEFATTSVAGQGLSALERLLFEETARQALLSKTTAH